MKILKRIILLLIVIMSVNIYASKIYATDWVHPRSFTTENIGSDYRYYNRNLKKNQISYRYSYT